MRPVRAEVEATMVYKILSSLNNIKDVRFSISKLIFQGAAGYAEMTDDRYIGVFTQWSRKATMSTSIRWEGHSRGC